MLRPLANSRPILATEVGQFGGAERSLLALSSWLHSQGLAHYFLTYFDHCDFAQYASHPLTIVQLKPAPGPRNKIASLRKYFADLGALSYKPLASGYQAALHATLAGVRGFHCIMHDTPALFGDRGHRSLGTSLRVEAANWIIRYGFWSGGKMMVNSQFLRAECRRNFGADAEIVRMGGFVRGQSPRLRPANGQLRMLSVCRIEGSKRLDWILRALAQLEMAPVNLSARVDWRVDFVGSGSQIEPLKQLAAALGIAGRVHLHGFLSDEALNEMYERAHLFLMPAIQGYGIPAIESLQRGIPVLLHRESGASDILMDTPWATVLHGGESNMLAAMSAAIDNVIEGKHHNVPQPKLPTEAGWAEQVAKLCNWI